MSAERGSAAAWLARYIGREAMYCSGCAEYHSMARHECPQCGGPPSEDAVGLFEVLDQLRAYERGGV